MPKHQSQAEALPVQVVTRTYCSPPSPTQKDDPKYMVYNLHIKTVAYVIGVVYCLLLSPLVIDTLSRFFFSTYPRDIMPQFFLVALSIGCLTALFWGLKRDEKRLLIPFFVWQCLLCIICTYAAFSLLVLDQYEIVNFKNQRGFISETRALLAGSVLAAVLSAWWSHLVYRCYKFLEDFEDRAEPSATDVAPSAPASQQNPQWSCECV